MTGPENTDVEFVVSYRADTGWTEDVHTATRAFLSTDLLN
jgi:hypothetical protein